MRWVAVVLLSGCSSILGIDDFKVGDGGTTGNEMVDQGYCLGPTGWRICLPAQPTMEKSLSSDLTFDTANSPACADPPQPASWKAAGQPDACFIIGSRITVTAALRGVGSRPIVLFASDAIVIESQFDVSSRLTAFAAGAGAPSSLCVDPTAPGNGTGNQQAGGGAGGSFTTKGGEGGASASGAAGGRAANAQPTGPMILRAGCDGGAGGDAAEKGGAAGRGGGAIYLVAGNRITLNGFINASGSAGRGGQRNAGGGGGGSGGMIHLHAPAISGNGGALVANGGGGGEGGDGQLSGATGGDPMPEMPQMTPLGGNGQSSGGAGGNGFATMTATSGAAGPVGAVGGGGGGGGAGGFIRANVPPSQIVASPPVTVVP